MQDNALIELFLPIITAGLTAAGYTGVATSASFQPTRQGVNSQPTVYFFKVGDHRYGFLKRFDKWDTVSEMMIHTEIQNYETTFQVSAWVIQNPASISYTASDLVNSVAQIMQSEATVNTLNASNVGILRVEPVLNPYFIDDKDRYEASPSFTFTLTHKQVSTVPIPVIQFVEYDIFPI